MSEAEKTLDDNLIPTTRIEMSVIEYNAMQDRIHTLEREVIELEREINKREDAIRKIGEISENLMNTSLLDRIIKWHKIVQENIKILKD